MSFKKRHIFGDFQTPAQLADDVVALLERQNSMPASVVEPSCGRGRFLSAAQPLAAKHYVGVDIDAEHLRVCRRANPNATLLHADAFEVDWSAVLAPLADPLWVIGNPPWVTNAAAQHNVPVKTSAGLVGLDAVTGRSNFDISEWMLRHLIDHIAHRDALLAMLCKRSVARKLLAYVWQREHVPQTRIYAIDAARHFDVAVDACLFVSRFAGVAERTCSVYDSLAAPEPSRVIGFRAGELVADLAAFERSQHLVGPADDGPRWRSGIKHDCSRVVELRAEGNRYRNGLGELVELEPELLFPMLKSSELARGGDVQRVMLVSQRHTSDDTSRIAARLPKTWRYLQTHRELFERRASSIYRNRPAFAMFGVGAYSFADWKVAVSGFYNNLAFRAVGPHGGKPVVFDDTCYFLPCADRAEAEHRAARLSSPAAVDFFRAHVFADNKRPLTARLLSRLNLSALTA